MGKFFEKLRGLEERKRKIAVWVMSAIAMFLVVLMWAAYMRAMVLPAERTEDGRANIAASLAQAAASIPHTAALWIESSVHYLFQQREIIIEK